MDHEPRSPAIVGLFLAACLLTNCALISSAESAEVAQAAARAEPDLHVPARNPITILYDAFGRDASLQKDWGFAALIEIGGKRVLFDTGNDSTIFARNAVPLSHSPFPLRSSIT